MLLCEKGQKAKVLPPKCRLLPLERFMQRTNVRRECAVYRGWFACFEKIAVFPEISSCQIQRKEMIHLKLLS